MRRITRKVPGGKLLRLDIDIQDNTIKDIRIFGDFFMHPEESIIKIEADLHNIRLRRQSIIDSISSTLTRENIQMIGLSAEAISDAVLAARPWRLIIDKSNDAFTNMATDEAVMSLFPANRLPTLRFYQWKPKAISIGYFQDPKDEIDIAVAKKKGVDIVRRITGGGAVYHDAEITYSIVLPDDPSIISSDIQESYKQICMAVIIGLKSLGITAEFQPINDILVDGKKVSGNAQTRRNSTVLQHGTIIIDVDVDEMFSLLLVPDEKLKGKMISDVKSRVTSLKKILGKPIDTHDLITALKRGFEQAFSTKFEESALTAEEKALAEQLSKGKFQTADWNYHRKSLNNDRA